MICSVLIDMILRGTRQKKP